CHHSSGPPRLPGWGGTPSPARWTPFSSGSSAPPTRSAASTTKPTTTSFTWSSRSRRSPTAVAPSPSASPSPAPPTPPPASSSTTAPSPPSPPPLPAPKSAISHSPFPTFWASPSSAPSAAPPTLAAPSRAPTTSSSPTAASPPSSLPSSVTSSSARRRAKTRPPCRSWPEELRRVCGSTLFHLGPGTCSLVKVGRASLGRDEVIDNVLAAIEGVVGHVPNKWKNVKCLHLKATESLALPLYRATQFGIRTEGSDDEEEEEEEEERGAEDEHEQDEGALDVIGDEQNRKKRTKNKSEKTKTNDATAIKRRKVKHGTE
ncbi:unnamed protein product, partial [Musa banksii]